MSRNGSGTHSLTDGTFSGSTICAQQKAAGVKIVATRMDTILADISTALTESIARDGQTSITADIPFAGFELENIAAATALTSALRADQAQKGAVIWGGTSGGSANAQTLTLSPAPSALTTGMVIRFIAGATNTGAATLNVNNLGAVAIRSAKVQATALHPGAILSGQVVEVLYDGSVWRLLTEPARLAGYTPATPTLDAGTLDSYGLSAAGVFRLGKLVLFYHNFVGTPSNGAATYITGELPGTMSTAADGAGFAFVDKATVAPFVGGVTFPDTTHWRVYLDEGTALGTNVLTVRVGGFFIEA